MVISGGWVFLMSEVPLYTLNPTPYTLHPALACGPGPHDRGCFHLEASLFHSERDSRCTADPRAPPIVSTHFIFPAKFDHETGYGLLLHVASGQKSNNAQEFGLVGRIVRLVRVSGATGRCAVLTCGPF